MQTKTKTILLLFAVNFIFFYFTCYPEESITRKEVYGRLASLSPLKNPSYITVEYMSGKGFLNRDIHLYLEPGYRVLGKDFISAIKIGDVVIVGYDEIKGEGKNGKETITNIGKTIEFIRSGSDMLGRQFIREEAIEQASGL